MKANTDIHKLFENYLAGNISKTELEQLLDHFGANENDETLKAKILLVLEQENEAADPIVLQLGEEVKLRLAESLQPVSKVKSLWFYIAAVAAILIAISIATIYFLNLSKAPRKPALRISQEQITPGSDKAILMLSDGRRVSLTESSSTQITDIGGKTIAQVKDGMINYLFAGKVDNGKETTFNTILVPQGGQYKVVLPDGSKAWLNSGSSLRYAVNFGLVSRMLELTGEGYFDVVKNKKLPFTVKSGTLEVTALGTQFNVNTYSNEPYGAATLVEGALKVLDTKSHKAVLLSPGQQAYQSAGILKKREVNTFVLTAWKDGLFVISKASLNEVMRQVERWYDVTVDVKFLASKNTYSGEFPRDIPLEDFLRSLESVTGMKYKIEGRRIVTR